MSAWLAPTLARGLLLEPPALQSVVARLAAPAAATRLAALDGVLGLLLDGDALAADAPRALPYLLGLATAPGYPEAAAILTRVGHLCAAIDHPPRRLAGAAGTETERRVYDAVGAGSTALVELARRSKDPTVARLAATLAARFPDRDAALAPILLALVSGAPDADERAPLLYALARIQTAGGAPIHRRLAEALRAEPPTAEGVAVALALLDADPPPHEEVRLRAVVAAAPTSMTDPRGYGRRFAG